MNRWWCSIVTLVYQRVNSLICFLFPCVWKWVNSPSMFFFIYFLFSCEKNDDWRVVKMGTQFSEKAFFGKVLLGLRMYIESSYPWLPSDKLAQLWKSAMLFMGKVTKFRLGHVQCRKLWMSLPDGILISRESQFSHSPPVTSHSYFYMVHRNGWCTAMKDDLRGETAAGEVLPGLERGG